MPHILDNIVSYWRLDEANGTRVDVIGGNDLTDNNTVTQAAGKVGNAALFTAANSEWLSRNSNASLQVTSSFFWTAWVYINSKAGLSFRAIVDKWQPAGGFAGSEYSMAINTTTDRYSFAVANATTGVSVPANNFGSPGLTTWHFLCGYYNATAQQIGISVNNGTFNTLAWTGGLAVSTHPFQIGKAYGGNYWDGRIDEVGFWKRIPTADDITFLYNGGLGRTYPFISIPVLMNLYRQYRS